MRRKRPAFQTTSMKVFLASEARSPGHTRATDGRWTTTADKELGCQEVTGQTPKRSFSVRGSEEPSFLRHLST